MAYLKSAIQISINNDKSFTICVDKRCTEDYKEKEHYDYENDLIYSAMNEEELLEKLKEIIPSLKPIKDRFSEGYNLVK